MRGECPPNVAMVTDLFTIHSILPDIIMMMMGVALVTIPSIIKYYCTSHLQCTRTAIIDDSYCSINATFPINSYYCSCHYYEQI